MPGQIIEENNQQILLVEDELNIRAPLARALRLLGYTIFEACCGQETINILQQYHFDLLIIDIQLPDINGSELVKHIAQQKDDWPVIILTGHTTLAPFPARYRKYVTGILFKPVRIAELNQFIEQALQKNDKTFAHQPSALWPPASSTQPANPKPSTTPSMKETMKETMEETMVQQRIIQGYPLILDCLKQMIMLEGNPSRQLELTNGETVILASLMLNTDQVLSCSDLVRLAWGQQLSGPEAQSIVRPYISRLRSKLRTLVKKPKLIRTVRRRGYHFVPARVVSAVVWAD